MLLHLLVVHFYFGERQLNHTQVVHFNIGRNSKRNRPNKTLDKAALIQDIVDYPDAYQYERARRLKVSQMCIWYNLKKLNITYKKNTTSSESRRRKACIVPNQD